MNLYTAATFVAQAAEPTATDLNFFWTTTVGGVVKGLLAALGIMVVLIAIFKAFKHVATGKPGEAAKIVVGAAVLAAFMFNPEMLTALVSLIGDIIDRFITGGGEVIDNPANQPAG